MRIESPLRTDSSYYTRVIVRLNASLHFVAFDGMFEVNERRLNVILFTCSFKGNLKHK